MCIAIVTVLVLYPFVVRFTLYTLAEPDTYDSLVLELQYLSRPIGNLRSLRALARATVDAVCVSSFIYLWLLLLLLYIYYFSCYSFQRSRLFSFIVVAFYVCFSSFAFMRFFCLSSELLCVVLSMIIAYTDKCILYSLCDALHVEIGHRSCCWYRM